MPPKQADRTTFEIAVMKMVGDKTEEATCELSIHLRVLEGSIMEFAKMASFVAAENLRAQILERIDAWMKADEERPERPLLFCVELYDWLYPRPPEVPQSASSRWIIDASQLHPGVVPTWTLLHWQVEAVSLDQALHKATVRVLLNEPFTDARNTEYVAAYAVVRKSITAVPEESWSTAAAAINNAGKPRETSV